MRLKLALITVILSAGIWSLPVDSQDRRFLTPPNQIVAIRAGRLFDAKSGRLLWPTLVFDGRFRNYAPYDDPPGRFGAVVEWSQEPAKR